MTSESRRPGEGDDLDCSRLDSTHGLTQTCDKPQRKRPILTAGIDVLDGPAAFAFRGHGGVVMVDRAHIEAVIELLVSVLDIAQRDPDSEDTGEAEDDEGGGDTSADEGEPDFGPRRAGDGPGCSIADPDGEHDGAEPDEGVSCACYGVDQSASGMSEQAACDSIDAGPIRLRRRILTLRAVANV